LGSLWDWWHPQSSPRASEPVSELLFYYRGRR
jgi:hypothetical protein